jgi:hypothetical protein
VVPGKLRLALLPRELVPWSTVVGAVTVTVTFAAKFVLSEAPQLLAPGVALVWVEVLTVPRKQEIAPFVADVQVP